MLMTNCKRFYTGYVISMREKNEKKKKVHLVKYAYRYPKRKPEHPFPFI